MRNPKAVMGILAAAVFLAAAVGTASANKLSISNQQVRVTWPRLTLTGGGTTLECPVTLEGSFHSRTISKVRGALIGYITRAEVVSNACTGGSALILKETLPWHVRYRSFRGPLPTIESVRIDLINASFLVTLFGGFGRCLFRSTAAQPAVGDVVLNGTGTVTTLRALPEFRVPLFRDLNGFGCPSEGEFAGEGTVRLLGSATTTITVRLI